MSPCLDELRMILCFYALNEALWLRLISSLSFYGQDLLTIPSKPVVCYPVVYER